MLNSDLAVSLAATRPARRTIPRRGDPMLVPFRRADRRYHGARVRAAARRASASGYWY
jgi:hypothetical protein